MLRLLYLLNHLQEKVECRPTCNPRVLRTLLDHFDQYIKISKKISAETYAAVTDIEEPGRMADIVASHLPLKLKDKQDILETADVPALRYQ